MTRSITYQVTCAKIRVGLALQGRQDGPRQAPLAECTQQPGGAHAMQRGVRHGRRRCIGLCAAVVQVALQGAVVAVGNIWQRVSNKWVAV